MTNGMMVQVSDGKVEIEGMEKSDDPFIRGRADRAKELTRALQARMSPKGKLKLPPLLDARRLDIGIPDSVFEKEALFDRILVFQFNANRTELASGPGGRIVKPETVEKYERQSCPTGVLVSAGLKALDELRSNGVDLGHIVNFTKLAVYRLPIDSVLGMEQPLIVLHTGDLVTSMDLRKALLNGECKRAVRRGMHVFINKKGKIWSPKLPHMFEG